jgi:hypothetical protein
MAESMGTRPSRVRTLVQQRRTRSIAPLVKTNCFLRLSSSVDASTRGIEDSLVTVAGVDDTHTLDIAVEGELCNVIWESRLSVSYSRDVDDSDSLQVGMVPSVRLGRPQSNLLAKTWIAHSVGSPLTFHSFSASCSTTARLHMEAMFSKLWKVGASWTSWAEVDTTGGEVAV